mmetsp:Transcript_18837/g.32047  ORF Transcript_18837/g.32047 Transcript_18837/m.32047 type:complete len:217 (-) Transcript_18837:216-866(-)
MFTQPRFRRIGGCCSFAVRRTSSALASCSCCSPLLSSSRSCFSRARGTSRREAVSTSRLTSRASRRCTLWASPRCRRGRSCCRSRPSFGCNSRASLRWQRSQAAHRRAGRSISFSTRTATSSRRHSRRACASLCSLTRQAWRRPRRRIEAIGLARKAARTGVVAHVAVAWSHGCAQGAVVQKRAARKGREGRPSNLDSHALLLHAKGATSRRTSSS